MEDFIIPDNHIMKLMRLGVYEKWKVNLNQVRLHEGFDSQQELNGLFFFDFIDWSFLWNKTPELHEFWHSISKE